MKDKEHTWWKGGERALCERGEAFRKLCLPLIDPSLLLKGGHSKLPTSSWLLLFVMLLLCVVQSLSCV